MHIFENFDWSAKSIAKLVGLVLLGLLALAIAAALVSMILNTLFRGSYQESYRGYDDFGYAEESMALSKAQFAPGGIIPPSPGSTGTDAEDFEVKNFSANIKTRKLESTCEKISSLKAREEVIFERANTNEDNCNFTFKVLKENEAEIVSFIEDLKPEDFNENIQSIKGSLEGYDKQLEILEKKLASIEDTLEKAQAAYDDVTELATRKQDVESLATIIDSKLNLIEKLTSERLEVKQQIDRLNQNKVDQLDRLKFSFFNINVYKDLIFDWEQIKESWKFELKSLVRSVNDTLQGISVNLVVYIVRLAEGALYFFLTLFLLKYAWVAIKRIWKGKAKA